MQTKEYNHYNPRNTWESCIHDILVATNKMKELMRKDCVHLGEETFEMYAELDEIDLSANYIKIVTDKIQYMTAEDYACDMAHYLQHISDEEVMSYD